MGDRSGSAAGLRIAACGLVIVIGSAGPWVTVVGGAGGATRSLLDSGVFGWCGLLAGVVAAVAGAVLGRSPSHRAAARAAFAAFLAALGVGGLAAAVTWYVTRNPPYEGPWVVETHWGPGAVIVGAAAGAVLARRRATR